MPDDTNREWLDESLDPPDLTAPVGDRQWVPEKLLALDGKQVNVTTRDENGHPVTEYGVHHVVVPSVHKEAARRRGEDVDA